MKTPFPIVLSSVLLVAAIAGGIALAGQDTNPRITRLEQRRLELRLELVKERAALVSSDPELQQIHQQIEKLLRSMDRVLATKPSFEKLNAALRAVEKELDEESRKERTP